MGLNPILWMARWVTVPPLIMPVFIIASIAFMIPGGTNMVGGLWVHRKDLNKINSWWKYIPAINYTIVLLGWAINILGHILSDLLVPFRIIDSKNHISNFDASDYTYRDTGKTINSGPRNWGFKSV